MSNDNHQDPKPQRYPITQPPEQALSPRLEMDEKDYLEFLEGEDYTPEEATAFLQIMWNIMQSCVDIGWGLDSVQFAVDEKTQQLKIAFTDSRKGSL